MIPDEAVEAAAAYVHEHFHGSPLYVYKEGYQQDYKDTIRHALELAAPHMLRTVTSVAELDALSVGSVVRSDMGVVWEKDEYTEEPGIPWWSSPGDSHQYPARRISLPATILHEPETAK